MKFKRSRSTSEQIITAFFATSGHVTTVLLQKRKTVTAEWYINVCQTKVFEDWSARRPNTSTRSLLLHHDDTCVLTTSATPD